MELCSIGEKDQRDGHSGLNRYLRDNEGWNSVALEMSMWRMMLYFLVRCFVLNAGARGSGRGPTVPAPLSSLQPKERGDL